MIRSNPLQTSTIMIPDAEFEDFSWDFVISPRSKIQKNIESVTFGGFSFNGLQFKTGFLAETDHKWGFSLYANQVNAFLSLPKRDSRSRYALQGSQIQLICDGEIKVTHTLPISRDETAAAPRVLWSTFWINADRSWDDSINTIRIIFTVARECRHCLLSSVSQAAASKNKALIDTVKHINCQEFFNSDYLSDIILECKGKQFPAHRLLLSSRSSVFNRMFRVGMKEDREGRVVINDIEPEVLEELLRFMYCGEVSSLLGNVCLELFEAADKYDVEPLKALCENEMIVKINADNALEMYMTAELHDARLLKEKALEVITTNKKHVLQDKESFKVFVTKYPDIAYDLFNSFG